MSLGTSSGGWGLSSLFSWGSSSGASKAHARSRLAGGAKGLQPFFFAPVTGSGSPGRNARKIICRYGMGCTHVMDPAHRERFWHPPIPGEMAVTAAAAAAGASSSPAKGAGWGRASSSGSSAHGSSTGSPSSRCGGAAEAVESTDPSAAAQPVAAGQLACHECGLYFRRLGALRLHLQRKTAWSNRSLVGARVSCLVDCREWQEGLVLEYAPATGRHRVAFEHLQQARWMHMKRAAFFMIRRPVPSPPPHPGRQQQQQQQQRGRAVRSRRRVVELGGVEEADDEGGREEEDEEDEEAKQPEGEGEGVWEVEEADRPMEAVLAPLERWDYVEPLSLGYARAQACLHEAYGRRIQETGHKTLGHLCVTESDKEVARGAKSSLLYGELLPRGINKALLPGRLDGQRARVVYELGMGVGKVAMQCFLQFCSTKTDEPPRRIFGVELSAARYEKAEAAARRLVAAEADTLEVVAGESGPGRVVVRDRRCGSVLEMEEGNLLAVRGIEGADIVLLETDLSATIYPDLCALLRRMKPGARAFTYLDLRKIWGVASPPAPDDADEAAAQGQAWDPAAAEAAARAKAGAFPFRQLDVNRPVSDRYATSWSVNRGHHFYLWVKVLESGIDAPAPVPAGWEGGAEAWVPDAVTPPTPAFIAATSSISGQSSSAGSSSSSSSSGSSSGAGAVAPRGKAPPSHLHHHRGHQQGKEERRGSGSGHHRRAAPVRRQHQQQHAPVRQASLSSSAGSSGGGSSGGGVGKALRRFFFGWGKDGSAGASPAAAAAAAVSSPPRAYDEAAATAASSASHPQLSASASVDSPLP